MMDFTSMMDPQKMMDFTSMMDPQKMMNFKGMMDPQKMLKQMMDFNKSVFENSFKGIELLQEQTDRITKAMIDQATWLPEEGKKAISTMSETYKNNFDQFKTTIIDNFEKVEKSFSD